MSTITTPSAAGSRRRSSASAGDRLDTLAPWKGDGEASKHWQPRDTVLHYDGQGKELRTDKRYGNAFYAARKCAVTRSGQVPSGSAMTPRLRAECQIDLVTLVDRGAKK